VEQVIQVTGALLVLAAFIGAQWQRLATTSRAYLLLNLVGAGILAVDAAVHVQFGFLLLEGVWAIVAGIGLARTYIASPSSQPNGVPSPACCRRSTATPARTISRRIRRRRAE